MGKTWGAGGGGGELDNNKQATIRRRSCTTARALCWYSAMLAFVRHHLLCPLPTTNCMILAKVACLDQACVPSRDFLFNYFAAHLSWHPWSKTALMSEHPSIQTTFFVSETSSFIFLYIHKPLTRGLPSFQTTLIWFLEWSEQRSSTAVMLNSLSMLCIHMDVLYIPTKTNYGLSERKPLLTNTVRYEMHIVKYEIQSSMRSFRQLP